MADSASRGPGIGDYALISDMHSCALVALDGSIDWACFPRFDSPAVFARILDRDRGGYFLVAPENVASVSRRYLPETNVVETTFVTDSGVARLIDFMPVHPHGGPEDPHDIGCDQQIVRELRCESGFIRFGLECRPRFDYGHILPHVSLSDPRSGYAHGGADAISLYSSVPLVASQDDGFAASGTLRAGESARAAVTYSTRSERSVEHLDEITLSERLQETIAFWEQWSEMCTYDGPYRAAVLRSALTLKALHHAPSGGLVAAATTSLPEAPGGDRNWDYRFTWIRDASFALYALSLLGYDEEANSFKAWLEWSTAGRARDLQIMYGLGGERRLPEVELNWLDGHGGARPVRIGNAAHSQFQLDIYGEVLDSAHIYRRRGGEMDPEYWRFLQRVVEFVIAHWREPDEGIWETRGGARHFVFSKAMCWVAIDRAIKAATALDLDGDIAGWTVVREEIREDVLRRGYSEKRGAFVQAYETDDLDASNLLLPLFGFIRADDPRMRSTIAAIERELTSPNGFVYRYRGYDDGLSGDEGTFIACTLWLADNLLLLGETEKAQRLFEKVLGCGNDVGLLSEELDGDGGLLGNFPQAFSHLGVINTAVQLQRAQTIA